MSEQVTFVFFKDEAEIKGDLELTKKFQQELDSLEERAEELDKQRTQTICSIRYIDAFPIQYFETFKCKALDFT